MSYTAHFRGPSQHYQFGTSGATHDVLSERVRIRAAEHERIPIGTTRAFGLVLLRHIENRRQQHIATYQKRNDGDGLTPPVIDPDRFARFQAVQRLYERAMDNIEEAVMLAVKAQYAVSEDPPNDDAAS